MLGLLKADTLAQICADLEAEDENDGLTPQQLKWYILAKKALRDIVGGATDEMILKAAAR